MGAEGAVRIIHRRDLAESEDPGPFSQELVEEYKAKFGDPYTAARHGWVDDVIEPRETRKRLILGLRPLEGKREELIEEAREHPAVTEGPPHSSSWMLIGLPEDSARSMTILVHLLVEEGNARTWVHPSRIFLVRELPPRVAPIHERSRGGPATPRRTPPWDARVVSPPPRPCSRRRWPRPR